MANTPNPFLSQLIFEAACIHALEVYYWLEGRYSINIKPKCQRSGCKSTNVHVVRKKNVKLDLYQCNKCKKQFNVFTETPFQGTKIELRKWFLANWYLRNSYTIDAIAQKVGLAKRDTKNLIDKLKDLDEERKAKVGWIGFGFLWSVRRKYFRYLRQGQRKIEDTLLEEYGDLYTVSPKIKY